MLVRIAIDAMGNDQGPDPIIEGAASYLQSDKQIEIALVGDTDRIKQAMFEHGVGESDRLRIVHASQVMEMDDKVSALREKRDSSILVTVNEVKEGRADAMVALGNTAAAVGATSIKLRTLKGVHRPGIAIPLPTKVRGRPCVLIDAGANTVANVEHLLDYAVMASIYSEQVLNVQNPRVGLLNVGEERGKGNDTLREAYERMSNAPINFVGNVEGADVYNGSCDVVVTDGFTGNVVLKVSEELAGTISGWIKEAFKTNIIRIIGGVVSKGAFRDLKQRISYDRYGGAPLLGVNGTCIIGHGRSNPTAVFNALRVARECVEREVNRKISTCLEEFYEDLKKTKGEPVLN